MWIGKVRCLLPAQKLSIRIGRGSKNKLNRDFLRIWLSTHAEKNRGAVRAAQVLFKTELALNYLPSPLFPIFRHLRCLNGASAPLLYDANEPSWQIFSSIG